MKISKKTSIFKVENHASELNRQKTKWRGPLNSRWCLSSLLACRTQTQRVSFSLLKI